MPVIQRDPFGGLGTILAGAAQGFERRSRRQGLLEAARGFGGNAQLAQMLQSMPLNVAEPLFGQAILQQQQARIRAQQPLTPLQQAQMELTQERTRQLQQPPGGGLDTNQTLNQINTLRDNNRALADDDRLNEAAVEDGSRTQAQGQQIEQRNAELRRQNNERIQQFEAALQPIQQPAQPGGIGGFLGSLFGRQQFAPQTSLPTPRAQTPAGRLEAEKSRTELALKRERLRFLTSPEEILRRKADREDDLSGKRLAIGDFKGARAHSDKAEKFLKQADVLAERAEKAKQRTEKISAKAKKYGLTATEMKQETSGRNDGPTGNLLVKYMAFLRALANPADVSIAEKLRAKGIPLQAIMKRGRTKQPIKRIR